MEYVDGWSLATLQVDQAAAPLSVWTRSRPGCGQLCAALTYAHTEAGLLHLALKPANLMLNSRDQMKVTDFGIARSLQALAAPTDLNPAAAALGFLSPQLALGEKPTLLDDVYGLGATIYDLLTGTPPFYKGQVLAQICDRTPPVMTERLLELGIEDSIPLVVEDTIALCLAKDPAKRPQSIHQVLLLLERSEVPKPAPAPPPVEVAPPAPPAPPAVIAEAQVTETPKAVVEPSVPPVIADVPAPGSRKAPILAVAAICAVALLGLVGWLWATHGTKGFAYHRHAPGLPRHRLQSAREFRPRNTRRTGTAGREILIGGMFTQFGDGPHQGIARLQADGSLDETFMATAAGFVHALALQPDGKLLVAGEFTSVNGQACHAHRPAEPGWLAGRELSASMLALARTSGRCWSNPTATSLSAGTSTPWPVAGKTGSRGSMRMARGMGRSVRGTARRRSFGPRPAAGWQDSGRRGV